MNVDFQKLIEEGQRKEQERLASELFEKTLEFQGRLFDKAAHYNNLVTSLAFASFFAIWIWARDFLTSADAKLSIIMIAGSLIGFVFWTLISSFRISKANNQIGQILTVEGKSPADILEDLEKYQQKVRFKQLRYMAIWGWVFIITFMVGMLSGIVLLVMIVLSFFEVDFSLAEWILSIIRMK